VELPAPVRAVDLALSTIAPYGRPDLEARLRQTRARLLDDRIRVLVVGEFKQGKSMLVNALVSAPVCPVYDDVATSVPTVVQFAPEPTLTVVRADNGATGGPPVEERSARADIPLHELSEAVAHYVAESHNPDNQQRLRHVEIDLGTDNRVERIK